MGLLNFHDDFIRPEILRRRRPVVLEVGVQDGIHTRMLLSACRAQEGTLICVDPAIPWRVRTMLRLSPRSAWMPTTSLDALVRLVDQRREVDIVLLDGDHNYYTVSNELPLVNRMLSPGGVVFIHDVEWPYARRDLYYVPERIPAEARHPYARRGIVRGQSELAREGGFNSHLCNAAHEGGPRNGVLTAVDDFVTNSGGRWSFDAVKEEHGLGILRRVPAGVIGESRGGTFTALGSAVSGN